MGRLARPDRKTLEHAAKLLAESGFEVRRIGRFGISLAGEPSVFERELGIKPMPGKSLVADIAPRSLPLAKLVDQIEIAGMPDFFDR
jgi:hypothetical protein